MAQLTDKNAMYEIFAEVQKIYYEEMANGLQYLGEECEKRIRQDHPNNWQDQTGNLRSSIGYAVYEYGKQLFESSFAQVKKGSEGADKGKQYIESLASLYSNTYALVIVAGMEYAEHVERGGNINRKPRDVISGTELWAHTRIGEVLETYKKVAEKRINAYLKQA